MQRCQGKHIQRLFILLSVLCSGIRTKQMYQVQEQSKQTFKYLQNILAAVCLSSARSLAFLLPYIIIIRLVHPPQTTG